MPESPGRLTRSPATAVGQSRMVWVILTAALLVRIAVVFFFPPCPVREDAVGYIIGAERILSGERYACGDAPPSAIPPLFPGFLAVVFAVSDSSLAAVRVLQALIAVATYALVFMLARGLFGRRIALTALLLASFYPALIPWHGYLLTETLYSLTVAMFFFFLYRLTDRAVRHTPLLCGASLGLSLLTRENLILFPPLLIPGLVARMPWRRTARQMLLMTVAAVLTVAPWVYRNYTITGHLVLTDRVSYVLHAVTGRGYLSPKYAALVAGEGPPPVQDDLAHREKYGTVGENLDPSFVIAHPVTFARRMINRLVEYWFHPNGLWSLPECLWIRAPYVLGHGILMVLALVGILNVIVHRQWSAWGLGAVLAYMTVLNLTTWGPNPRYNLPFLPLVFVFTAVGATRVMDHPAVRAVLKRCHPKGLCG